MINREDMLELTRRMTPKRASITRIAGCYLDKDGEIDGTFNTNFRNLSLKEKEKNLAMAKAIPYAKTNKELKDYQFSAADKKPGSMWQLLMAMKSCGLKNDALMDIFYEQVAAQYKSEKDYAVFVFHGCYDVPVKFADNDSLWESEEVYEYLICAISPLTGEYEPGAPVCGFLFPAFMDRSGDENRIAVYQAEGGHPHGELVDKILFPK